mgnify:CR=1 FL=1
MVGEAKIMFGQGLKEARLGKMLKELAMMQYKVTMGKEKVCIILSAHKAHTERMVIDSLEKG